MTNQKLVTSKESKSESKIMSIFEWFFDQQGVYTVSKNVSNTDMKCPPYVSVNRNISTQKFVTLDKGTA